MPSKIQDHRDKIESIKDTYNSISKEFSASRAYIWPDIKPLLASVKDKSSILDVGCGNGRLLTALTSSTKYLGLDISSGLLSQAEKLHPDVEFLETDITRPDIWKHLPQYDYIFSLAVIHHLPTRRDHLFLLKEIKKHLKPKGKYLITAWNLWQPQLLKHHFDLRTKIQDRHFVYIPFNQKPRFHFAHTKPYLEGLLKEAGLEGVVTKTSRNYIITNFSLTNK